MRKSGKMRSAERRALARELPPLLLGLALFAAALIVDANFVNLPKWLTLTLGIAPVVVVGGATLLKAVSGLLLGRVLTGELLVAAAAAGVSCMSKFTEAFIALFAFGVGSVLGHFFAETRKKKTPYLSYLRPEFVRVELGGEENFIEPDRIRPGTVITVGKLELIPLDGVVVDGRSRVDTSAYTGQLAPVEITAGSTVASGYVNLGEPVKIRVTGVYGSSTLLRTSERVNRAEAELGRRERRSARTAKLITRLLVFFAAAIAVIPSLISGEWLTWTHRGLVVLSAASFAAPLSLIAGAYTDALNAAAANGIILGGKNGIDELAAVSTVVMDKTGTVTEGSFSVIGAVPRGISRSDLIAIAAAAELGSRHPIADALRRACANPADPKQVKNAREIPGRGVEAEVFGRRVLVGNSSLMNTNGIRCEKTDTRHSVVHVAAAGIYYGYIIIDDRVREGAKDAVRELYALGVDKAVLLTGDGAQTGRAVGDALGVGDVMTELSADDKAVAVGELLREQRTGKLAFVGSAGSDASVLAAADVGIAMDAPSAEAAASEADALIFSEDIRRLPFALRLCKTALKSVKLSELLFSVLKAAVLTAAVFGIIGVDIAVIAETAAFLLCSVSELGIYKLK